MSKVIPFRATGKRRSRKPRTAGDQSPPVCRKGDGDGVITIMLNDGTSKTISGKNLELDMEYRVGVPYLIVRERR